MRPERLTIRGLATYRDETSIAFEDLSLFAIVGPTGSGKSSIIDAMCFALYGRIPRLGERTFAPIISAGAKEMAVDFTFSIKGAQYRVVRRARPTAKGAKIEEASLERLSPHPEVLAGATDEVTKTIEGLIGLEFGQFTKTVVLPQGAFADLLRATPSDRHKLLKSILGIDLYDLVRERAAKRARDALTLTREYESQIAKLSHITPEAITTAQGRVSALAQAIDQAEGLTGTYDETRAAYQSREMALNQARADLAALDGIGFPPDALERHGEEMVRLQTALAASTSAYNQAETELAAMRQIPDTREAQRVVSTHERIAELTESQRAALVDRDEYAKILETRQGEVEPARLARVEAEEVLAQAQRGQAAAQAAIGLSVGDACPLCANVIGADAPAFGMTEGQSHIHRLQVAYNETVRAEHSITVSIGHTTDRRDDAQKRADSLGTQIAQLTDSLADTLSLEAAKSLIAEAAQAQDRIALSTQAVAQARATMTRDQEAIKRKETQMAQFWADLDRRRLGVGHLNPPTTQGQDVLAAWRALAQWAQGQRPECEDRVAQAQSSLQVVLDQGKAIREQLNLIMAGVGLGQWGEKAPVLLATTKTQAEGEVNLLREKLDDLNQWTQDRDTQQAYAAIYKQVSQHLGPKAFTNWLLAESTKTLIQGASAHLLRLSHGQFELALGGQYGDEMVVKDRTNANLARLVKTLSGGETFLASLALALALTDYIQQIVASPVAMECLFIDEGFGALDAESLDLAVQALEQIGSTDKMVGVISHVPELAERLPARIQVSCTNGCSEVVSDVL